MPRGGDLLYRQEIESFLSSFCAHCETADERQAEMPVVWQRMQDIWQEKGFLHPRELTLELLHRQFGDFPQVEELKEKIDFLDSVLHATYQKEPLTGTYESKQNSALLTALAHAYAQREGGPARPITMLEGDFSNMSGTNSYFYEKARQAAAPEEEVPFAVGHAQTDAAARILANLAREKLEEFVKQETSGTGQVFAARTGGDEIRLIVDGVDQDKLERFLAEELHPAIEQFIAETDLQRHPHTKYPDDKTKNGLGLVFASMDLAGQSSPKNMIDMLDKRVEAAKERIGHARLGELPVDYEKQVAGRLLYHLMEEDGLNGPKAALRTHQSVQRLIQEAQENSKQLASLRRQSLRDAELNGQTPWEVATAKADYARWLATPAITAAEQMQLPASRQVFEDPHTSAIKLLEENLKRKGMTQTLPEWERRVFLRVLEGYQAVDPVTRVQMPRDLPQQAALFAQDAEKAAATLGVTGGAQMLHVEFGNAGAFNKLSHLHADILLREEATILVQALKDQGIGFSPQEGAHPDADGTQEPIYHLGGGRFVLLLPSVRVGPDGALLPVDAAVVENLQRTIAKATEKKINQRNLQEFFAGYGLSVPEPLPSNIRVPLPDATLGDVQHAVRGAAESGVQLVTVQAKLDTQTRAGQQVYNLSQLASDAYKRQIQSGFGIEKQGGPNGRGTQTAAGKAGSETLDGQTQGTGAGAAGSAGDLSGQQPATLPESAAGTYAGLPVKSLAEVEKIRAMAHGTEAEAHGTEAERVARREIERMHTAQLEARQKFRGDNGKGGIGR